MIGKLKKRVDFVSLQNNSVYIRTRSIGIQLCFVDLEIEEREDFPVFLGITASRKVGNAVFRNLARRRIRAWSSKELIPCLKVFVNFQANHLKKIQLSKSTLKSFKNFYQDSSLFLKKKTGIVIVFIANKNTPIIEWSLLDFDMRNAVKNCFKQNTGKLFKTTSYQIPLSDLIQKLNKNISEEKNFLFKKKTELFLENIKNSSSSILKSKRCA